MSLSRFILPQSGFFLCRLSCEAKTLLLRWWELGEAAVVVVGGGVPPAQNESLNCRSRAIKLHAELRLERCCSSQQPDLDVMEPLEAGAAAASPRIHLPATSVGASAPAMRPARERSRSSPGQRTNCTLLSFCFLSILFSLYHTQL